MGEWDDLAEELREPTRNQADDIPHKLRMANCYMSREVKGRAPVAAFTKSELELLAEREHERWNSVMAKRFTPANPQFSNARDPNKRLRVGYDGPTFRTHVVGLYLEPILESHDHQSFEIFCYCDVRRPDSVRS